MPFNKGAELFISVRSASHGACRVEIVHACACTHAYTHEMFAERRMLLGTRGKRYREPGIENSRKNLSAVRVTLKINLPEKNKSGLDILTV